MGRNTSRTPKIEDEVMKPEEVMTIMYDMCSHIEGNNPIHIDSFPQIENERLCKYCNFKILCDKD